MSKWKGGQNMKNFTRLPDAELEVMQALWVQASYPASTAELAGRLEERHWQLPTLIKLLTRLEERGFVRREKEGRANLYTPLVEEKEYLASETRSFLERLHAGSLPSLVAALVNSRAVTDDEVKELETLLEEGMDRRGEEKRE